MRVERERDLGRFSTTNRTDDVHGERFSGIDCISRSLSKERRPRRACTAPRKQRVSACCRRRGVASPSTWRSQRPARSICWYFRRRISTLPRSSDCFAACMAFLSVTSSIASLSRRARRRCADKGRLRLSNLPVLSPLPCLSHCSGWRARNDRVRSCDLGLCGRAGGCVAPAEDPGIAIVGLLSDPIYLTHRSSSRWSITAFRLAPN